MDNQQFDFLDMLTLMSFGLQLMTLSSVTSDDIYRELRKQDTAYLETIVKQNNQILSMLENILANKG